MGARAHATQQVLLTSLDEGAIRGCVFRVVAPITTITGRIDGSVVYVQAGSVVIARSTGTASLNPHVSHDRARSA